MLSNFLMNQAAQYVEQEHLSMALLDLREENVTLLKLSLKEHSGIALFQSRGLLDNAVVAAMRYLHDTRNPYHLSVVAEQFEENGKFSISFFM